MTPMLTSKMSSQGENVAAEIVNVAFIPPSYESIVSEGRWNNSDWSNRKLASVVNLAGAEGDGDGSLWAVSKAVKYSPAPE